MRENRRWTFSLEEALLWKFWSAVIVWSENALMQDLFLTSMHLLALQDVNWKGKDMWPSMVCNSPFHHSKRTHTAVSSEHTHAHAHTHTHTHTHYNPCQYRDLNPLTFRLHKPLWWTEVVWITCDVFISCLDSHSDGTHSLQSIHWWDTDAETHFSKSDEKTNSSTSLMLWGWAHFQLNIFVFGD